jgi:hypothetical protein
MAPLGDPNAGCIVLWRVQTLADLSPGCFGRGLVLGGRYTAQCFSLLSVVLVYLQFNMSEDHANPLRYGRLSKKTESTTTLVSHEEQLAGVITQAQRDGEVQVVTYRLNQSYVHRWISALCSCFNPTALTDSAPVTAQLSCFRLRCLLALGERP